VLRNRRVIEDSITELRRRPEFKFDGDELMFTWNLSWWEVLSEIFNAHLPIQCLQSRVEEATLTMAEAVNLTVRTLAAV